MDKQGSEHIDPSLIEEAARWQTVLSSGDATDADIEQHMDWLLADPRHVLAEEHVAATMKNASEFEMAARSAFADDFRVGNASIEEQSWLKKLLSSIEGPKLAIGSALVAALLFVAVLPTITMTNTGYEVTTYASASGVQTVTLSDGSSVSLFEGTEISVEMTDAARTINLTKGRAFFDVVSNKERPFYVNTGLRQVRVVGTRFEVIREQAYERVAVNEGLVSVSSSVDGETHSEPLLIEPGVTAMYAEEQQSPTVTKGDADRIGAWTEGVLTFKKSPLSDVIAAVNELFPEGQLVLADEKLATQPFSGTLVVSSPLKMAQQLAEFMSLRLLVHDTWIELAAK